MRNNNVYYTGEEYSLRFGIFMSNLRSVRDFNKKSSDTHFTVGINPYSAYTPAEIASYLKGAVGQMESNTKYSKSVESLGLTFKDAPDAFDWRNSTQVVNPIKEQGNCGSCWAFSTITVQESRWKIVHDQHFTLSEQELIDCCTTCYGCFGGLPINAITYVIDNQHGCFEEDYHYPNRYQQEACKYNPEYDVAKITGYVSVAQGDESDLKEKLYNLGPVSILLDSSPWSFVYYQNGIYTDDTCSKSFFNHAVALVGYGVEEGQEYWILRNSWGLKWGEEGYMRIQRNKNVCGLAEHGIIPTVE